MKRAASIEALLKKANADFVDLRTAYESSLNEQHVRDDLKVTIKNIFENLRSCLDYLVHDIFDTHCSAAAKPNRLYFPIRHTAEDFNQVVAKDYPNLQETVRVVYDILEGVQPYRAPWLGQFNKLNNHNKHQDLVEQTRMEARQVTVSRGGGSVSWGPGVKFGPGVSVMGVPIDPRTQMPVPNNISKTNVVFWVDFRFKEISESVLPFVEASLRNVERLFRDLQPHI
jgi:hypothetical protein